MIGECCLLCIITFYKNKIRAMFLLNWSIKVLLIIVVSHQSKKQHKWRQSPNGRENFCWKKSRRNNRPYIRAIYESENALQVVGVKKNGSYAFCVLWWGKKLTQIVYMKTVKYRQAFEFFLLWILDIIHSRLYACRRRRCHVSDCDPPSLHNDIDLHNALVNNAVWWYLPQLE